MARASGASIAGESFVDVGDDAPDNWPAVGEGSATGLAGPGAQKAVVGEPRLRFLLRLFPAGDELAQLVVNGEGGRVSSGDGIEPRVHEPAGVPVNPRADPRDVVPHPVAVPGAELRRGIGAGVGPLIQPPVIVTDGLGDARVPLPLIAFTDEQVVEQGGAVHAEGEQPRVAVDAAGCVGRVDARAVVPRGRAIRVWWLVADEQVAEEGVGRGGEDAFAQPHGFFAGEVEAAVNGAGISRWCSWQCLVPVTDAADGHLVGFGVGGWACALELVGSHVADEDAVAEQTGPVDRRRKDLDGRSGATPDEPLHLAGVAQ